MLISLPPLIWQKIPQMITFLLYIIYRKYVFARYYVYIMYILDIINMCMSYTIWDYFVQRLLKGDNKRIQLISNPD